jgi:hypothetical protein
LAGMKTIFVYVVGGLVFVLVREATVRYHAPQWLAVVAFFAWLIAFFGMLFWLRRARHRARAAWNTPPNPPPGQPQIEPVEQCPEMAVPARVRRPPDGTAIIEPMQGSRVA